MQHDGHTGAGGSDAVLDAAGGRVSDVSGTELGYGKPGFENPHFVAIRLFNNPDGWVAHFTGSDIAGHFNRLEN